MKKILLLLLLATFGMQAQTLQNPTYGNVKLKNNTQSTTATKVNVQEADGTINTISKYDLVNVVDVNDVHSLPLVGEVGKIYVVKNLNKIYRWNGAFYHELAGSDLNYQSIIDALTFTPENVANKATTLTASTTLYPNNDAVIAGLATKEDKVNKVTSIGSSANDTNYPSELAVKTYADNLVVGMLNDRGTWDASINAFPTTGGSGVGGAIRKGDMWYVSVAGTLGTKSVNVGDSFRALVNDPAQVAANWSILEANIGYVPANDSNVVHLAGAETITGGKTFSSTLTTSTNIASSTTNMVLSDNTGAIFRGVRASAWADVLNSRFFQIGATNDNVVFSSATGTNMNRTLIASEKLQILSGGSFSSAIIPAGVFEIANSRNRLFNVFLTGNSSFGGGSDDGINRLQVSGTISSGTTALNNTPPTANNQLTRKDYVDAGLNSKEPSFSKNTAFNKNFGTTAGTVVEGNYPPAKDGTGATGTWGINISGNAASATLWNGINYSAAFQDQPISYVLSRDGFTDTYKRTSDTNIKSWLGLGSNAYTSTAYLPLTGGDVTGPTTFSSSVTAKSFSSPSSFDAVTINTNGFSIEQGYNASFISAYRAGGFLTDLYFNALKAEFSNNVNVLGTITASPATASNHVVVKSQLDAVANIAGTSGSYTPSLSNLTNISNSRFDSASYTKIGNVVTARVSLFITAVTPSVTAVLDFLLPVPRVSTNVTGIGLGSSFEASMVVNTNSNTTTARLSYQPLVRTNHQVVVMFQYIVD